jgi:hypothetical protein
MAAKYIYINYVPNYIVENITIESWNLMMKEKNYNRLLHCKTGLLFNKVFVHWLPSELIQERDPFEADPNDY